MGGGNHGCSGSNQPEGQLHLFRPQLIGGNILPPPSDYLSLKRWKAKSGSTLRANITRGALEVTSPETLRTTESWGRPANCRMRR